MQDLKIPSIGLGTWQMEGDECVNAVENALEMGYRHIDTARIYGNEEAVGRGIERADVSREEVFLTTKVWRDGLARDDALAEARGCLERLGVDHVDLLLVHWPNDAVPLEEALGAFERLRDEGLTRHIGVSNFTPGLLDEARAVADIVLNQVEMHPYFRQEEMVSYCREHDLALTAYSPLARGRVVDDPVLQEIGDGHDRTAAQVALRWLIQHDNVAAIPKAAPADLQRENLAALEFELDREEMDRIGSLEQRPKLVDPGFAPWQ